ncbi:MAG: toprim domain-containing protein [Thermodesulfovibrionales bacterium]
MIRVHTYMSKDRRSFKPHTTPSSADLERASRLREVMETLYEVNKKVPVIVEGKRDAIALRRLGLVGEIVILHRGNNIYEFCEDISERFDGVIILLDWDREGENLNRALGRHLKGLWEEFSGFREILKMLCQKEIKDIEGIPKLLKKLEGNETVRH